MQSAAGVAGMNVYWALACVILPSAFSAASSI
jgi:hypothetical protein